MVEQAAHIRSVIVSSPIAAKKEKIQLRDYHLNNRPYARLRRVITELTPTLGRKPDSPICKQCAHGQGG